MFLTVVFYIKCSYYVIFTSPDKEEVIISNIQYLCDYFDETVDHVSDFAIQHLNKIYFRFLDNDLWSMKIFAQPHLCDHLYSFLM
ncbi:unnamed protein product [Commensalibacter communis]|nr:unnamed protein product [Commensalibacter communis]